MKMKNLLSENMLRFGTKNLSESQQKELTLKSIMKTIEENGLTESVKSLLMERINVSIPNYIYLPKGNYVSKDTILGKLSINITQPGVKLNAKGPKVSVMWGNWNDNSRGAFELSGISIARPGEQMLTQGEQIETIYGNQSYSAMSLFINLKIKNKKAAAQFKYADVIGSFKLQLLSADGSINKTQTIKVHMENDMIFIGPGGGGSF
jgi:hypothetical protein